MIIFVPKAGLSNRLRGIASAYRLAKHIGESLTVLWIDNHECNCPLSDLFQVPDEIQLIHIPWIPGPLSLRMHLHDAIRRHYQKRCTMVLKDDDLWDMEDAFVRSMAGKQVYLESAAGWDCEAEDAFEIFRVVPELERRITMIRAQELPDEEHLIGVHIRRTDHTSAIEEAPRIAFEEAMEAALKQDPDTCFYLASDDEEEKRYFSNRFGKAHIYTHTFELNRESNRGMKDAVVELYLLGSGKEIYGTTGSSYSNLAAALTKTPLMMVGKH